MFRHRQGSKAAPRASLSSSDDDDDEEEENDAFASLQKRQRETLSETPSQSVDSIASNDTLIANTATITLPKSTTSSMKRHHGVMKQQRQEQLQATLLALQEDLTTTTTTKSRKTIYSDYNDKSLHKSSLPSDEMQYTTNIFVGNLDTNLVEKDVINVFTCYGPLQSVKIMWPKPTGERLDSHKGFVCFVNRRDAEVAMKDCDNQDVFNVGRRLRLNWGKPLLLKQNLDRSNKLHYKPEYQSHDHHSHQYGQQAPPHRYSNCSDDNVSSVIPQRLDFKSWRDLPYQTDNNISKRPRLEQTKSIIAPTLPALSSFMKDPRYKSRRTLDTTNVGNTATNSRVSLQTTLTSDQLLEFNEVCVKKLTTSRIDIGHAMAFCYDHSRAATQICDLLLEQIHQKQDKSNVTNTGMISSGHAISNNSNNTTLLDQQLAYLYLLSDLIYNSQQPGVVNAFVFRDRIEKSLAPAYMAYLGTQKLQYGRLTFSKVDTAVQAVLNAWNSWSIYPPNVLDHLRNCFDQGSVVEISKEDTTRNSFDLKTSQYELDLSSRELTNVATNVETIGKTEPVEVIRNLDSANKNQLLGLIDNQLPIEGLSTIDTNVEGITVRESLVGKHVDRNFLDQEPLSGKPLDDNQLDGGSLEDEELDGEPLEDEQIDGASIANEELDGEPLEDEQLDGELIEDEQLDGNSLSDEELDGAPLSEKELDGEALDGRTKPK